MTPGTTYHYAVRAVRAGRLGPISGSVSATTPELPGRCPGTGVPDAGQLVYPGGRYSLVGLPAGTVVASDSPLYTWPDQGAGASYVAHPPMAATKGGAGYWAWFACPRLVTLRPGYPGISLPLGAYHASMVGNPSPSSESTVSGHDFAARWDASLNGGAGGYDLSGYREPHTLAVGEGAWVFSYVRTEIHIEAAG